MYIENFRHDPVDLGKEHFVLSSSILALSEGDDIMSLHLSKVSRKQVDYPKP